MYVSLAVLARTRTGKLQSGLVSKPAVPRRVPVSLPGGIGALNWHGQGGEQQTKNSESADILCRSSASSLLTTTPT